jgi:DNA-binding SARP family transcriptional activator
LLALLLLSPGRMVTANTLIDRLWGDDLPADPPNALQLRVSKLRRALAQTDASVVRDGVGYRADVGPESVDVEAFAAGVRAARALRDSADRAGAVNAYGAALDRWAGEPLADFADQPWALVEAARLTQLRLAALTERAQLLLALGRAGDVVADLDPVVGAEPTQESLAGLLMTGLYQSGRQADALEVYARTRDVLDDELGLEPSAALRALHQKVLAQDASLAPAEPAAPQPSDRAASPGTARPPRGATDVQRARPCGRADRPRPRAGRASRPSRHEQARVPGRAGRGGKDGDRVRCRRPARRELPRRGMGGPARARDQPRPRATGRS